MLPWIAARQYEFVSLAKTPTSLLFSNWRPIIHQSVAHSPRKGRTSSHSRCGGWELKKGMIFSWSALGLFHFFRCRSLRRVLTRAMLRFARLLAHARHRRYFSTKLESVMQDTMTVGTVSIPFTASCVSQTFRRLPALFPSRATCKCVSPFPSKDTT